MNHIKHSITQSTPTPWKSLGSLLPAKDDIDTWARKSGMAFQILETPVRFHSGPTSGSSHVFDEQKVLYRSDTMQPLSVVSNRYKTVQPLEILEFFRSLAAASNYEIQHAGLFRNGRRFWALASTGRSAIVKGSDRLEAYLLLATSCDGSLATSAALTSIRVCCSNSLQIAINGAKTVVKVPHSTTFDAGGVKAQLGLAGPQFDNFMAQMRELAGRRVSTAESERFFRAIMNLPGANPGPPIADQPTHHAKALRKMQDLFNGHGIGAELGGAKGTAWGLLNAVTEYTDHHKPVRSGADGNNARLEACWHGTGAVLKDKALSEALALLD